MTELSTAALYEPVPAGAAYLADLTPFVWPSYRRVTLDQGGDHDARFVVDEEIHDTTRQELEYMFYNWIGCHFVETYAGVTVFAGYVHALRLQVGGLTLVHTMEDMANNVRVYYQTGSAGSLTITSAATNTASDARYGTRATVVRPGVYMTSTYAAAVRDDYLAAHAYPRMYPVDIYQGDEGAAVLEVEIRGYTDTIGWLTDFESSGTASNTAVSTQISNLLSGLDYVSAGTIATISTAITDETDYVSRLQRINDLLENRAYSWGCFRGRSFDVTAWDTSTIKYRRRAFGPRAGIYSGGQLVPAPLVQPSGIVFTEDVFAGLPAQSTLLQDPRAAFISGVEYTIDGARLIALSDVDELDAAAALAMEREELAGKSAPPAPGGQRAVEWLPPGRND